MNYKNKYIGNEDQLMTVHESTLCQGRQQGVKMIHVENGGDLSVTILPDKGMDIYQIRYKGKNLSFIAPNGIVAPEYYDARDCEWLRTAAFGFLTTIGLQHFGGPRGLKGLHGRASCAPAEDVKVTRGVEKGRPVVTIEGTMREAALFCENLRLHRTFKLFYEENKLEMIDVIENYGFKPQEYVFGYHINYGWPLLDENTKIEIEHKAVKPRDEYAGKFFPESTKKVTAPAGNYPERCYIYDMKAGSNGKTGYTIKNAKKGLSVKVSYDAKCFPKFCQWQLFENGQYVTGLEPISNEMDGPLVGDRKSPCPKLKAGEAREYKTVFEFGV